MCDLCDECPKVREREELRLKDRAQQMIEFAHALQGLASGRIKPHEKPATQLDGRHIVRFLVAEWL